MTAIIVVPTNGQQQNGQNRTYARINTTVEEIRSFTEEFIADGEPVRGVPDLGYLYWVYRYGNLERASKRIQIDYTQEHIFTDLPTLEVAKVVVVPRLGANMQVSLRRTRL